MLGWCKEAISCASSSKRVTKLGSSNSFGCSILIATYRFNCVSNAFHTSAIPPCPSRSRSSYFPRRLSGSILIVVSNSNYCHLPINPAHPLVILNAVKDLSLDSHYRHPKHQPCHCERSEESPPHQLHTFMISYRDYLPYTP